MATQYPDPTPDPSKPQGSPPEQVRHTGWQEEDKLARLKAVAEKHNLAGGAVARLRKVENYDVVIIADDSGSMRTVERSADGKKSTRWDELRIKVAQVVEIASCLDQNGIDVYFLNGGAFYGITDPRYIEWLFNRQPTGFTPLRSAYAAVLDQKLKSSEKDILVLIFTDGEPNTPGSNGKWESDIQGFSKVLIDRNGYKPERCPTVIMACTDNDKEIGWMDGLDRKAKLVDVMDDYESERAQVLKTQGEKFPFTVGDYLVKSLLGCIDPLYDGLDEKRLDKKKLTEYLGREPEKGECSIM